MIVLRGMRDTTKNFHDIRLCFQLHHVLPARSPHETIQSLVRCVRDMIIPPGSVKSSLGPVIFAEISGGRDPADRSGGGPNRLQMIPFPRHLS